MPFNGIIVRSQQKRNIFLNDSHIPLLDPKSLASYKRFLFFLLLYALVIILWGAWVRISGSGDGCGPHWPLCQGQIWIDKSFTEKAKTLIELTHRLKSGLFGILILFLFFWARRIFPARHWGRFAATLTLVLTITESLLGMKLVLLGLVADNSSALRAFSMSLHLGNTLLLLFAMTACWESGNVNNISSFPWPRKKFLICHFCLLTIAITGSWAALASTLFPTESLLQGLEADFSSDSHWLLRIRLIHPLMALSLALLTLYLLQLIKESSNEIKTRKLSQYTQGILLFPVLVGMTTLLSSSPTIFKLLHLLSVDIAWIALSRLSIRATKSQPRL